MPRVLRLLTAVVLCAGLACAGSPERSEAQRVRDLESRIWSPYCPGRLLSDCSTRPAAELRETISQRVGAGQSDAEVLSWVRSNFGDEAMAAPAPGGRGTAIWLVPLVAIAAGVVLVVGLIRRWAAPADTEPEVIVDPVPDEERDEWVSRVRQDLERDT